QVLQANPNQERAVYIRAVAENGQGNTDAAIRDLESIRAHPVERTLLLLGQLLLQKGRTTQGKQFLAEYNQSLKASETFARLTLQASSQPNSAKAHLDLGRYYLSKNNTPRALVELKAALELDSK